MRTRLLYYWDSLRTSYWFVPAVLNVVAALMAIGMVTLDRRIQQYDISPDVWWIYGGGPEGARMVMSTIAGSMITVAGVVFSITIVALTLASGQYGPRLLRNFIRDRSNQVVLGTFTGTFIYCLLVLRTILGNEHDQFVPGAAVAGGIVLALASIGVLIFYIHHVAILIQANQVVAAVSLEMRETIDRLWPEELGQADERLEDGDDVLPKEFEQTAALVTAEGSGYVGAIEQDGLMELARKHGLIVQLIKRPGHFVLVGSPLARVVPPEQVDEKLTHRLNELFLLETQRTPYQDIEFTVDQLVEVAVRALSPGINDPFTAMICVDWLAEAISRLAQRSMPSAIRYDEDGNLRVVTSGVSFTNVVDAAFHQIRQYGSSSASVMIHMLDALASVGHVVRRSGDRVAILRHARLIRRACQRDLPEPDDLADVEARYTLLLEVLGETGE